MNELTEHLHNLLLTGEDSDFTVIVSNEAEQKIHKKVHKLILQQSPYFKGLFRMQGTEAQNGCVELTTISEEIFNHVLDYLYGKDITVSGDDALEVAVAASYLQLPKLKLKCLHLFAGENSETGANKPAKALTKLLEMPDRPSPQETLQIRYIYETFIGNFMHWKNADKCSMAFLTSLVSLYGKTSPAVCVFAIDSWIRAHNAPADIVRPLLDYINLDNLQTLGLKHLLRMNIADEERTQILKKQLEAQSPKKINKFKLKFKGDLAIEFERQNALFVFQCTAFGAKPAEKMRVFNFYAMKLPQPMKIRIELQSSTNQLITSWTLLYSPVGKISSGGAIEANDKRAMVLGLREMANPIFNFIVSITPQESTS